VSGCGDSGDSTTRGAATPTPATGATPRLDPTPACGEQGPTTEQTEGPYFIPGSPERSSLIQRGVIGDRLVLSGLVLGTDCRPLPRAVLDFWQADGAGVYDNEGDRLRGHQRADSRGRWRLETVVPGRYPGRTPHLHLKVARPRSSAVLTTQLYLPGEPSNEQDSIFDPALLIKTGRAGGVRTGRFDLVLPA